MENSPLQTIHKCKTWTNPKFIWRNQSQTEIFFCWGEGKKSLPPVDFSLGRVDRYRCNPTIVH